MVHMLPAIQHWAAILSSPVFASPNHQFISFLKLYIYEETTRFPCLNEFNIFSTSASNQKCVTYSYIELFLEYSNCLMMLIKGVMWHYGIYFFLFISFFRLQCVLRHSWGIYESEQLQEWIYKHH